MQTLKRQEKESSYKDWEVIEEFKVGILFSCKGINLVQTEGKISQFQKKHSFSIITCFHPHPKIPILLLGSLKGNFAFLYTFYVSKSMESN